jgi:PucR C-terminal helix-turn-helix domain/GGDEF-like domain
MSVTERGSVCQELAAELLPSTPELAREMAEHLYGAVPELAALEDDEIVAELAASAEANIRQVLWLFKRGAGVDEVTLPPEAASFMRSNVRRGIPLPSELRGYRLGHAWLWDRWVRALQKRIQDPEELIAAQDVSSALIFAYVDRISGVLVEEYGTERERMMRGATQLRAETVRAILTGEPVDEETLHGRLGYDIRRRHVAMRVASSTSEVRGLERAAREAAAAVASGEPLILPSGAASLDVWSGSYEAVDTTRLERYEPPKGIRVAFGRPAAGLEGFRRSHREAIQAARVAALARDVGRQVVGYAQVELVSLLASDLPRAREFVATQLGPLAAADEASQRLRLTLRAFLAAGGRSMRAAKELYVHQNTVTYRVKRAEELLDRRVTEDPIELTCALMLADTLGPAVLVEEPPPAG